MVWCCSFTRSRRARPIGNTSRRSTICFSSPRGRCSPHASRCTCFGIWIRSGPCKKRKVTTAFFGNLERCILISLPVPLNVLKLPRSRLDSRRRGRALFGRASTIGAGETRRARARLVRLYGSRAGRRQGRLPALARGRHAVSSFDRRTALSEFRRHLGHGAGGGADGGRRAAHLRSGAAG